jgi:hypothetical protein
MRSARHLQRGGRHERTYQGWSDIPTQPIYTTAPLDEADQLALNQEGNTPPQPWVPPKVRTPPLAPPQPIPAYLRWIVAGVSAMAGGFVVLVAVLALALALAPDPAQANDPPSVSVQIKSGKVSIPNGTYTIERVRP